MTKSISGYYDWLELAGGNVSDDEGATPLVLTRPNGDVSDHPTDRWGAASLELGPQKCIYCQVPFAPTVDPRVEPTAEDFGQWGFTRVKRFFCEGCGWWLVTSCFLSGPSVYGNQLNQSWKLYEGIIKSYDLDSVDIPLNLLRSHLEDHTDDFGTINPTVFELLVRDIYKDFYEVDVKHVGGPGDHGIDLYAVIGDQPHMIQVKRRSKLDSTESVSTVREFVGALVTNGVRNGHIVTTADHYSAAAQELVANANLKRFDIEITLNSLDDLLSMLALTIPEKPDNDLWQTIGKVPS